MKDNLKSFKQSVEIWSIRLSDHQQDAGTYQALLNREELDRAARLREPDAVTGFILCRGLLRKILAECLSTNPRELCFERTVHGKPFIKESGLEFNVSHSRDRLLIAVTAGRAVGVDIEFRRSGLNMQSIARRWFAPEEQAFFQSLENPEAGFFDIWAKKEAYVKALGTGIYKELNSFAVPLSETPFVPTLGIYDANGVNGGQWFFQTLEIDSAYAAAVVCEAPVVPVNLRTL